MNRPDWTRLKRRRQASATISDLDEPPNDSVLLRRSHTGRVWAIYLRDDAGADEAGYPPGAHWYEFVTGGDESDVDPTTWLLLCQDVNEEEDTLEPVIRTKPRRVILAF